MPTIIFHKATSSLTALKCSVHQNHVTFSDIKIEYQTKETRTNHYPTFRPHKMEFVWWNTLKWCNWGRLHHLNHDKYHYNNVIMGLMASQITSLTIVYSKVHYRSKKTSKLRVTGLCAGNSPATGEFPAQKASNAEHVPIWWRHHDITAVYPMKYVHGFVVLCFVAVISSGLVDSYDIFIHILQGYFTGTGAIALPQCQWSNPEEYG